MLAGPLACFLSSLTWAIASREYSLLTEKSSPYAVGFLRGCVGVALFGLATFYFGIPPISEDRWGEVYRFFTIAAIASYGLGDAMFFLACRRIPVPIALSISSVYPIWTWLFELLNGRNIRPALLLGQGLGAALAIFGVTLCILGTRSISKSQKLDVKSTRWGVLLALITSVFWALNAWAGAEGGKIAGPFFGNFLRMCFSLPILLVLGTSIGTFPISPLKKALTARIWLITGLEVFIGSSAFIYGLTHSPRVLGVVLTSLAPVLSVLLASTLWKQKMSIKQGWGVVLTTLGILVLSVCKN